MKWILAVMGVMGCVGEPDVVVVDQGRACAWSVATSTGGDPGAPQTFAADQPVWITAELVYPGCQDDEHMACEVDTIGDVLRIRTRSTWNEPPAERLCTREVHRLTALCLSTPLARGTYTLVYGAQNTMIEVPGTTAAPCLANP